MSAVSVSSLCEAGAVAGARVALPEAAISSVVLDAARQWVDTFGGTTLLVDDGHLGQKCEQLGWEPEAPSAQVVPISSNGGTSNNLITTAVELVASGQADALVAGVATSSSFVLAEALRLLRDEDGWASEGALLRFASGRVVVIADCAVTPEPTALQMAAIAKDMAEIYERLTGEEPVIALLSYVTGEPTGSSGKRGWEAAQQLRDLDASLPVAGPLQLDAAVDRRIAGLKGITEPVGGNANVLIFPSLDAANLALKLSQHLADAELLCVAPAGFRRPIVNLSRGATAQEVLGTIGACAALTKQRSFRPS